MSQQDESGSDYLPSDDELKENVPNNAVDFTPATKPTKGKKTPKLVSSAPKAARSTATKVRKPRQAVPKLKDLLTCASKDQLVNLLVSLSSEYDISERAKSLLPPPDLDKIKADIGKLERKMWSSFPRAKWGTNRDQYAYKRVAGALQSLKQGLLAEARTFQGAKNFVALKDYLVFALRTASNMPSFDNSKNNGHAKGAADGLCRMLNKSMPQFELEQDDADALHRSLESLGEEHRGVESIQTALNSLQKAFPDLTKERRVAARAVGISAASQEEEEEGDCSGEESVVEEAGYEPEAVMA